MTVSIVHRELRNTCHSQETVRDSTHKTYSLNLLLCIFLTTSLPTAPAIGLLTSELKGLVPGERGLILIGDVWLIGERFALPGVPV